MDVYAYGIGCIMCFAIWAGLYVACPRVRKPMLLMSLLVAPLGLITLHFFTYDYWQPRYLFGPWLPLEELLFSFSIAGIGGVAYEACFGSPGSRPRVARKHWWAFGFFALGMCGMWVGSSLGLLSVHASSLLLVTFGVILVVLTRRVAPSLFSAVVCVLCMLMVYVALWFMLGDIAPLWKTHGILGPTFFGGVPLEELLWVASWGFFAAPAFELVVASRYSR